MAAALALAALLVVGYQVKVRGDERAARAECLVWQDKVNKIGGFMGNNGNLFAGSSMEDERPEDCPIP